MIYWLKNSLISSPKKAWTLDPSPGLLDLIFVLFISQIYMEGLLCFRRCWGNAVTYVELANSQPLFAESRENMFFLQHLNVKSLRDMTFMENTVDMNHQLSNIKNRCCIGILDFPLGSFSLPILPLRPSVSTNINWSLNVSLIPHSTDAARIYIDYRLTSASIGMRKEKHPNDSPDIFCGQKCFDPDSESSSLILLVSKEENTSTW